MTRKAVLLIHGGAGLKAAPERLARVHRALRRVGRESYAALRERGALEAVVAAVSRLEDNPLFNAGTGSMLQQDGCARMSASVMDGATRRFASVLNIERVRHPIAVAAALLEEPDRVLAGEPAMRFARSIGCADWNPVTPERLAQWRTRRRGAHGTVGAVALDAEGHLAAATSTGGKGFERPGRVSDSGMPVANYADDAAAVACTGIGEDVMDEGLALRIAQRIDEGASTSSAMTEAFRGMRRRARRVGAIALNRCGQWAWATTLPVLWAAACGPRDVVFWRAR